MIPPFVLPIGYSYSNNHCGASAPLCCFGQQQMVNGKPCELLQRFIGRYALCSLRYAAINPQSEIRNPKSPFCAIMKRVLYSSFNHPEDVRCLVIGAIWLALSCFWAQAFSSIFLSPVGVFLEPTL